MRIHRAFLLCAVFFVGCSSGSQVGDSCSTDEQCGAFKCLRQKRANPDRSCSDSTIPPEGNCSPPCSTHADCTKYGATFRCALSQIDIPCNPTGVCLDDYRITCNPGPCREAPEN